MKMQYNANSQNSKLYQHWNKTTAMCYFRNMVCDGCMNDYACRMNRDNFNTYYVRQVKFATLMTYANIGAPKKDLYED
jgi:hypothetical protein